MIDIRQYIDSGVVEAYCLGSLPVAEARELTALMAQYPELEAEVERTMAALEGAVPAHTPGAGLKDRVLGFLDQFLPETTIDLQNPPLIDRYSDVDAWRTAVRDVKPELFEPEYNTTVLKMTDDHVLSVVWLNEMMAEEPHLEDEFLESFLILEGACECNFGGRIVRFGAGDYFEIPPNTHHTIRNISESGVVMGLVQRRRA